MRADPPKTASLSHIAVLKRKEIKLQVKVVFVVFEGLYVCFCVCVQKLRQCALG